MKNFLWLLIPFVVFAALPNTIRAEYTSDIKGITRSAEIVPVEPAFVNNAYQIGSAAELLWFEQKTNKGGLNKNAVLTADIDYGGNYWVPISAGDGGNKYTGTFDGQGYTISNLVLNTEWLYNKYRNEGKSDLDSRKMIQNSGFIGTIGNPGIVKNLTLDNVTVYSNVNGGLGKTDYASIIRQPISVGAIVGWICGDNGGGTVDNITVSGNLEAEGIGVALGGIAGNAGGGKILNSTSLVIIKSLTDTSEVYIGGITGYTKNSPVFRNDKWLGEIIVNAGDGSSGGVTGYVYSGTLTVDNVEYNEEGVEDAVGKSCDKCAVSGDLDYGIYKIYTVNGKKVCELDGAYKHAVQDGVFTVKNTVDSLVFNRKFIPGKSSTFAVPFEISKANITGAKFYKLDSVSNVTGTYTAYLSEETSKLVKNRPYIVVVDETNADSTISISGSYSLASSTPGTTKSTDNNWELQAIYKYTTGADRGERRTKTYGFVARDTVLDGKQWHAGQFVKMGTKAYVYPFRVLLEFIGDVNSLPKSALDYSPINEDTPDVIEVHFSDNAMAKRLPESILNFTPTEKLPTNAYYKKWENRVIIIHDDKKFTTNGKELK
jgi:hypothetical protein